MTKKKPRKKKKPIKKKAPAKKVSAAGSIGDYFQGYWQPSGYPLVRH